MKNKIFSNWPFARLIRLMIGLAVVGEAIYSKDFLIGIFGLFLASMAIFNFVCCANGACNVPTKKTSESIKDISFEEIL